MARPRPNPDIEGIGWIREAVSGKAWHALDALAAHYKCSRGTVLDTLICWFAGVDSDELTKVAFRRLHPAVRSAILKDLEYQHLSDTVGFPKKDPPHPAPPAPARRRTR